MTQKSNAAKAANGKGMSAEQVQAVLKQNEELLKRIELLEKKEQPKSYEEQIQFFQVQQQVISHLQKFQDKREVISHANELIKEKTDSGDFEAKVYTLSMHSTNGEKKTIFNITNPILIGKVLESVTVEIDTKIGALKEQLTL